MNINEMHVRVRGKLDRENSLSSDDLTPGLIDLSLQAASLIELERRYGVQNQAGESFDMTAKRRAELSTLHVFSPSDIQPPLSATEGEDYHGIYYYTDFDTTAKPLWVLTGLSVKIRHTNSSTHPDKVVAVDEIERDDLDKVLTGAYTKPSYNWGRVPVIISKATDTSDTGRLFIYTGDDFGVAEVYPSYLHFPTPVFFGGYNSLDGLYVSGDPQVNSDMPQMLHQHIVDTAASLLTSNLQDSDLLNLTETIRAKNEF
jgi:hypothetical protein